MILQNVNNTDLTIKNLFQNSKVAKFMSSSIQKVYVTFYRIRI